MLEHDNVEFNDHVNAICLPEMAQDEGSHLDNKAMYLAGNQVLYCRPEIQIKVTCFM